MTDDFKKRLTGILEGTELSEDQKAKLEDIFPELKENKEEKVKKALALYFRGDGFICNNEYNISYEEIRAWLEKQKETPLSVWSENDHEMVFCIRKIIEKYAFSQSAVDVNGDLCEKEYIDADDWMESVEGRLMQVPKQEWSAEDEEIKNIFVGALDLLWEKNICFDHKSKSECLSWIRSIENRIVGKPKHE